MNDREAVKLVLTSRILEKQGFAPLIGLGAKAIGLGSKVLGAASRSGLVNKAVQGGSKALTAGKGLASQIPGAARKAGTALQGMGTRAMNSGAGTALKGMGTRAGTALKGMGTAMQAQSWTGSGLNRPS